MGIIYKATNLINNKVYIGQTVQNLEERRRCHNYESIHYPKTSFNRAIKKYGKDSFVWEVIDLADSPEELNEKEIYWISYYKSTNKEWGYNTTIGGKGCSGMIHSWETLEKMKESHRERWAYELTQSQIKEAITKLIEVYGRFPKIEELARELKTNNYQVQQHLKGLVHNGFLLRQGNWYMLNPTNQLSEPAKPVPMKLPPSLFIDEKAAPLVKEVQQYNWAEKMEDFEVLENPWTIPILRIIMGIIGVGAVFISMYFTFIWSVEVMPWLLAALLSGIMVGFAVFSFEIVILFITQTTPEEWYNGLIAVAFFILWIIVTAFSITTTIAGQYNQHALTLQATTQKYKKVNVGRTQWDLLELEKSTTNANIANLNVEITKYNDTLKGLNPQNKTTRRLWDDTQWQLSLANRKMTKLTDSLNNTITQEKTQLESNPESTSADTTTGKIPDFYGWISGLLKGKMSREQVQFWMSLFPAVFVDIISPAALSIALFLHKKRRDKIAKRKPNVGSQSSQAV